jgi:hypothetical protein
VVLNIVPHPRTLRKARMHVQQMVTIGISTKRIRRYLHHFLLWWANTTKIWNYEELITWFCEACFDICPAAMAAGLLLQRVRASHNPTAHLLERVGFAVASIAA